MKTNLFEGQDYSPQEIVENLEGECWGFEDNHAFVKPFTDAEYTEVQDEYIEKSKKLYKVNKTIDDMVQPLKDEANGLKKETKGLMITMNQGGKKTNERVYLIPDNASQLMGLYDSRGILVDTRPMTMLERKAGRQMHINNNIDKAI